MSRVMIPLVFSTVPRYQGECGSQKNITMASDCVRFLTKGGRRVVVEGDVAPGRGLQGAEDAP